MITVMILNNTVHRPHLLSELVVELGEHGCSGLVVRNDGILYVAATGKVIEVVAGIRGAVHPVENVSCSSDAFLGEAVYVLPHRHLVSGQRQDGTERQREVQTYLGRIW